jgi:hypothetical protein
VGGLKRWWATLALVGVPPLVGLGLTRFPHAKGWRELPRAPSTSPSASADAVEPKSRPAGPHCMFLEPGYFTIEAGGSQRIRAIFSDETGETEFVWTASGGTMLTQSGATTPGPLRGHVIVDRFDGAIDPMWWRSSIPAGATTATVPQGLVVTVPRDSGHWSRVSLRRQLHVEGDFGAELRVRGVVVDGDFGAGSLDFLADDGFVTHVARIVSNDYLALESNARWGGGPWLGSHNDYDIVGERRLWMKREGKNFGYSYTIDGRDVDLGPSWSPGSIAAGFLEIRTGSVANEPRVVATYERFSLYNNDVAVWRAAADTTSDDSFVIQIDEHCKATGRVLEPVRQQPRHGGQH